MRSVLKRFRASLSDRLDVLGPAVQTAASVPVSRSMSKPNFVAIDHLVPDGASASPTSSSLAKGP